MRMTIAIARAAAQDAGNARMFKAGRTSWNSADYNHAARVMTRLLRLIP